MTGNVCVCVCVCVQHLVDVVRTALLFSSKRHKTMPEVNREQVNVVRLI